jgi:hypothetical protein
MRLFAKEIASAVKSWQRHEPQPVDVAAAAARAAK